MFSPRCASAPTRLIRRPPRAPEARVTRHPTHGVQALRWITHTCVAFDGLCCVASTILSAPERLDTSALPVAGDAMQDAPAYNAPPSEGGSAPMHTDAPWPPAAPEEQPAPVGVAPMDVAGGDSGGVHSGG